MSQDTPDTKEMYSCLAGDQRYLWVSVLIAGSTEGGGFKGERARLNQNKNS